MQESISCGISLYNAHLALVNEAILNISTFAGNAFALTRILTDIAVLKDTIATLRSIH